MTSKRDTSRRKPDLHLPERRPELRAARLVREAGFSRVSSIKDSFEGEPDARVTGP